MAVKSSGSLSITTDIVGEFGGQAPHSLSEYYRNGANVPDAGANSAVPTSGEISFADFYGAVSELGVTISADTTDLNLLAAIEAVYGTQSASSVYRVSIANGVTIGASSSAPNNAAITWGDFPNGSTITLVNDGDIEGLGGTAGSGGAGVTAHSTAPSGSSGSSGGDAIYANYSNQTMNITNNGSIRGGGGGAGGGGGGGKGGDGVASTPASYGPYQYTRSVYSINRGGLVSTATARITWGGAQVTVGVGTPVPPNSPATSPINITYNDTVGGFTYNGGPYVETWTGIVIKSPVTNYGYSVRRKSNSPVTTNYDGGNGGAGGVGGVGQGYNQPNTNGSSGSSGSTGSGPAGNGGTGGTGGNGGTYGNAGAAGSTGSSGAAGNNPPGASSGGSGGAGGAAGRYIVKGSNTVTVTGSGTTAGGVA